ncbi:MAG: carboxypeptidase regulatory-like domain-containing protein [Acidobacteriia bacterium]|nr:carboxypeptidase regulatory-like domain-containing protein [Terriglobia bacterium]
MILVLINTVLAQAPVGTISGTVSDESGAVIPNASVIIKNKTTGIERDTTSGADGRFAAPALAAGQYEIRVEVKGFRTVVREATVEVGLVTTADMRLPLGQTTEVVNVEAATAQIEYEKNSIDGVVGRAKIEGLPLNGRSYMQLASAEPGVRINTSGTSQYNSQFSVSVLGGDAGKTAISVDGGPVRDRIEGSGSSMNFSQEVVQEFQLSEVNFDLSTDITSVGSINIVTRSGGNDFHASGYFFFRDHNMAAYPGLRRTAPADPFFARRNPGFWVGGPIVKDKAFFFFNYEYMNQLQAVTTQPDLASLSPLAGSYGSPYTGKTLSARFDYKINSKHNAFLRYSHDGNQAFGPGGNTPLYPSAWLRNVNWADQATLGLTSTLTPTTVNDFRFSYNFWSNRNLFPNQSDCASCVGLGLAGITFVGSSLGSYVGDTQNATQGRDLRDFTWTDNLTWQKGSHRIRVGGEIGLQPGTGFWGYCDPGCFAVYSPEYLTSTLTAAGVAAFFPNLPKKISSTADIMNLPFVTTSTVIGIGDPSQPPLYNIDQAKSNNRYRIYASDTWKIKPNFTLNLGLAYEYESNLFNEDLSKPSYLAPLYGSDLSPTQPNHGNISPAVGFAWNVGSDNKTVIRGGAGIYYDTEYLYRRLQERSEIGPVGNGRSQYPTTNIINTFPNIVNVGVTAATGKVTLVPQGQPLPTNAILSLTLGQFMQLYDAQVPGIAASLAATNLNDLSVRQINVTKSGADLLPHDYPVQHSYHTSIGMQRQLRHDLVISADYVRRVFLDVLYGEPDLNGFNRYINGVQSPVIPLCTAAQRTDRNAQCSSGAITFWQPGQRNTYQALLVKADKRLANRFQFTASYALAAQNGVNGIYDLTDYNSSYGPQGARNTFSVIGMVDLPWGFQLGLVTTIATRGPVEPIVTGIELNGLAGVTNTPLPGLSYNCLNRGCGASDLAAAVANFNATYAGKKDAAGKPIPTLTLPSKYEFGEGVNTEDVRLTKVFTLRERYKFSVFGEMFNIFNISNLSGFNFNINSGSFGIPTQRAGQVFGSAGPRALQVGGRFSF